MRERVKDVANGAGRYVVLVLVACVWGALHYLPVLPAALPTRRAAVLTRCAAPRARADPLYGAPSTSCRSRVARAPLYRPPVTSERDT